MGESAQTKRNKSSFIIKIYVIIIIKLCSFGCTSNDWAPSVIEQSEMVTAPTANTNQPIPFKEYHSFHRWRRHQTHFMVSTCTLWDKVINVQLNIDDNIKMRWIMLNYTIYLQPSPLRSIEYTIRHLCVDIGAVIVAVVVRA